MTHLWTGRRGRSAAHSPAQRSEPPPSVELDPRLPFSPQRNLLGPQEIRVRAVAPAEWGSISILGPSVVKVAPWGPHYCPLQKLIRDMDSRMRDHWGNSASYSNDVLPAAASRPHSSSADPEWGRQLMCHRPRASLHFQLPLGFLQCREAQAAYLEWGEDLQLQFETMKALELPPGSYPGSPAVPCTHHFKSFMKQTFIEYFLRARRQARHC